VRVFVIWEPILLTDWRRPGAAQTAWLPDPRAMHFWDLDHRLSGLYGGRDRLAALAATPRIGFTMRDVIWDAALVYPPGLKWGAPAELLVAPVVKYRDELARSLELAPVRQQRSHASAE
jgi:hypothetical protein